MTETASEAHTPGEVVSLGTMEIVQGSPDGQPTLGLLLKRTYDVRDGMCHLADDDQQEPLISEEVPYAVVEPPEVSPIAFGCDTHAFKLVTDLVVQASAYTYGDQATEVIATLETGSFSRSIRVVGDRFGDFDAAGKPVFTPALPFASLPIRYDHAYGGVDVIALDRYGFGALGALQRSRPGWQLLSMTPYHYPRNPAGSGYVMELDAPSFEGLPMPNLELADSPLSPRRVAFGQPAAWVQAPLPAGLDWQAGDWFPRMGYLGSTPDHMPLAGTLAEVKRGWAAGDILDIPPLLHQPDKLRREFGQAASPGMALELRPDASFLLRNMHRRRERYVVALPGEVPEAAVTLPGGEKLSLTPHLNSVVIRPDDDQVVVVWCARAPVARGLSPEEEDHLHIELEWRTA